ncbi:MAG: 50S ribosomal protein L30 [Clostridia bacterium]|nr:50S ribosomal protein L30 [Clostridia bacterium]
MSKIKITLVKSINGANQKQIATVHALGLRKIGQSVVHEATPSITGMVRHVAHLVQCEEV